MQAILTDRQERFVLEYLKDQNASAAAARAGYTAKNMAAQGNELMSHPAVRERVRLAMQDLLADLRASAVELMKLRVRAAFFDPAKLVNGWEPRPLDELDEETRSVLEISTVMRKSGEVIRVKQPDRHRALRALEKAYEKLEQLNERHYDRLERQGLLPSLEEIEAMADQEERERAAENEKKPGVLSGATTNVVAEAPRISETPQVPQGDFLQGVFSGCVDEVALAAAQIAEKAGVLSDSGVGWPTMSPAFSEKPEEMSGCPAAHGADLCLAI